MVQWGDSSGVEIANVTVPDVAIAPGQAFEVDVLMRNHESISFGNPDACSASGNICRGDQDGFCLRVTASVQGDSDDTVRCLNLPFSGIPPSNETWTLTLTAPSIEGSYTVTVVGEETQSGNTSQPVSAGITVSEDVTQPPNGDNGGNGGNGEGDLTDWVINHPAESLLLGVGGAIVLRQATETATEETF